MKYTISGDKSGTKYVVVSEGTYAKVFTKGKDKNFKKVLDSVLSGTYELEHSEQGEAVGAVFTVSTSLDRDNIVDDFVDFLDLNASSSINSGNTAFPICSSYTDLAHQFLAKYRLSGSDVSSIISFASTLDINHNTPVYPQDLQKVVETYWMDKRYMD